MLKSYSSGCSQRSLFRLVLHGDMRDLCSQGTCNGFETLNNPSKIKCVILISEKFKALFENFIASFWDYVFTPRDKLKQAFFGSISCDALL